MDVLAFIKKNKRSFRNEKEAIQALQNLADQYPSAISQTFAEFGYRDMPVDPKSIFACMIKHKKGFSDRLYDNIAEFDNYEGDSASAKNFSQILQGASQVITGLTKPDSASTSTSSASTSGLETAQVSGEKPKEEKTTKKILGIPRLYFIGIALIIVFLIVLFIGRKKP